MDASEQAVQDDGDAGPGGDADPTALRIDGEHLWDRLMELGRIGEIDRGGVCRLAGSDEDKVGRDLFVDWCHEVGLAVAVDRMGNIFARREGTDPTALPVLVGSHLDSQPAGGRFDGAYGVLAALEVVRTIADAGIATTAPLEVVAWTNEEGARFAPAMLASGVFAGAFPLEYGLSRTDPDGITLGDELVRIGYSGELPCGGRPVGGYLEAHIEQGPILEAEDLTVGVVTTVQGIRWFDVTVNGAEAHAGSTPMDRRRDALVAAAGLIGEIDALSRGVGPEARSTVGVITAHPASRNTIAGSVDLTVDLRHPDPDVLIDMTARLGELVATAGGTLTEIWYSPPIQFDPRAVTAVRDAAVLVGEGHRDMISGAGHDACYLAGICPTAMVFVPCRDGISHNPTEWTEPSWCAAGANVLLEATLTMAGIDGAPGAAVLPAP